MFYIDEQNLSFYEVKQSVRDDMRRWYEDFQNQKVKDWPYFASEWFNTAKIPHHMWLSSAQTTLIPKVVEVLLEGNVKSKFFEEDIRRYNFRDPRTDLSEYQKALDCYENLVEDMATNMAAFSGLGVSKWRSFIGIAAGAINKFAAKAVGDENAAHEARLVEKNLRKLQKQQAKSRSAT